MKRRSFVAAAALAGIAGTACSRVGGEFRTLSDAEGSTLAALCAQIIPADDYPGADQAGAVRFIDIQLTRRYRIHRDRYRQGLGTAETIARARFQRPIAVLTPEQQSLCTGLLEREAPEFFALLLNHTMQSYYGSPRHGGNRDGVSYRMLGLYPVQVRGRERSEVPQPGKASS